MKKYKVASASEIRQSKRTIVKVKDMEIGVFYVNGNFYAYRNICPHGIAPVCVGRVTGTRLPSRVYEYEYGMEGQILRCPWHGWEFDLETGKHLVESGVKLRSFPIEVEDDDLYIVLNS